MSIFFRIAVTLLCSRAPVEQGRQDRLVFVVVIVVCIVALGRTARCRIFLVIIVCSALFRRRIVECAAPVQVAAARFVECAHHDARRRRRRAQRQWCRYT